MSDKITMVYDIELKRPGCAILQGLGGCSSREFGELFPSETWLLSPTPGMRTISGTLDQWRKAAAMSMREVQK